jgi:hypothetical protein
MARPVDCRIMTEFQHCPTMTTSNPYELNCLIEGEEITLVISVPRTAKVKELMQIIYREGELGVLQYRLLDLALWKVCQEL